MITTEGQILANHWAQYGRQQLDSYLIQNVEHPSINPQSVLMRAFLVDRLAPGKFVALIEEEFFFAACACHILAEHRHGRLPQLFAAIRNGPETALPEFMRPEFSGPRMRSFTLERLVMDLASCTCLGFECFDSPFQAIWAHQLSEVAAPRPRMLEIGCGSANDYRFWNSYGLAALIDYTGIDVCPANIENSKRRFPEAAFSTGDACALDDADGSFDVVFGFDVLEHLSPLGLDAALNEAARLACDEIWVSLFNAQHAATHDWVSVEDYHWNALSISSLARHLGAAGFTPEIVPVADELEHRFPGYTHYNRSAFILIGRKGQPALTAP